MKRNAFLKVFLILSFNFSRRLYKPVIRISRKSAENYNVLCIDLKKIFKFKYLIRIVYDYIIANLFRTCPCEGTFSKIYTKKYFELNECAFINDRICCSVFL